MVFAENSPDFGIQNPYASEEASVHNERHSTSPLLFSLMKHGGYLLGLLGEDARNVKTRLALLKLDIFVAYDRVSHLVKTKQLPRTAPMISMFAVVPAAAQVDQPVEAPISCPEAVQMGAFQLHPDGGTPNGGFYCTVSDTKEIHPGFLTCPYVERVGSTIGAGPYNCWEDDPIDGSNIKPFDSPAEGIINPAPIVPPASPELTATPSPQSSTPEVEEKPSISLENMDDHSKNALKVAVGALVSAAGLALLAIIYTISTGGAVKGSGSVSASSTQESIPSSPPSQEQSTHNTTLGSSAGDGPSFEEELAERWARVFRLIGRLSKPTVRPDEKDN